MMKTIKIIIALVIFSQFAIAQDYQIGEKPEPLEKKKFEFPEFTEKVLDNGLKVFFIEDHEQPMVSFNILMPGGDALEAKKDAAGFTAAMMMKGTKNKSALDISKTLDGLGASISVRNSTEFTSVSGSSIMKHKDVLFETLTEILTSPTFPEEEMEKLKTQFKTALKSEKSNPASLASNMAKKVLFGSDHPYASVSTEETIDAVTKSDLEKYYNDFYIPNSSTMYIVGDFDTDDMVDWLNEKLSVWEKGEVVKLKMPKPEPMPRGIYFIERPGSVQSAVRFANMTVPFSDRDYMNVNVANHVINSSFAGRMFKIIREKHSYTYSPTGGHSANRFYNYSIFGSDVRNEVTDSTVISVTNEILGDLISNGPTEEELETIKQFRIGQFYLNFESSGYLGSLIQRYDFRGVPIRMIKEYPNLYNKVSKKDVQKATKKYLNPQDSYLIVVGDPSVKEQLEKFGPIFTYDTDYKPASALAEADIDADELIEKYTDAIGGDSKIESVSSVVGTGTISMNAGGQSLPGKTSVTYSNGMMYRLVDLNVYKVQDYFNGKEGWENSSQGNIKLEGESLEQKKFESDPFKYSNYNDHGYNLEVTGKKEGHIVAKLMKGEETIETLYFNENTYLLDKTEKIQESPRGNMLVTVTYEEYQEVEGIKFPKVIETETPMFSMKTQMTYKVNQGGIDNSMFTPKK